jgi:hypothetical protein
MFDNATAPPYIEGVRQEEPMNFTIRAATEYGIGGGVNGLGRRQKVSGFYVIAPQSGRKVRAFTGKNAEAQAKEWALKCDEMAANGHIGW